MKSLAVRILNKGRGDSAPSPLPAPPNGGRGEGEGKFSGKVGVFLGGNSRERPISLRSGSAVGEALKEAGVSVCWFDPANGFQAALKKNPIDLAFIALHGSGGEDGTIQKFLDRNRIPYVGSNALGSIQAFDKIRAKAIFKQFQIPTPPFEVLTASSWKRVLLHRNPPYVVKPVREGSSIGVFFVESSLTPSLRKRIETGIGRYGRLLAEDKIEGREFTVGILGDEALPVIELRPKRKFYDYQAKYTIGLTDYLVPAPIESGLTARLQALALRAHRALGLRDFSRIDFMVDPLGNPFVLEANSIPGFTETSLLPKAARAVGLDFQALCLRLIQMAQERMTERSWRGADKSGI